MNFSTTSTMSINGISVTLSVQCSDSSLRRLFEASLISLEDETLADLSRIVHAGMPDMLHQAHGSVCRSLLIGASEILLDEIDEINELAKQEEQAA